MIAYERVPTPRHPRQALLWLWWPVAGGLSVTRGRRGPLSGACMTAGRVPSYGGLKDAAARADPRTSADRLTLALHCSRGAGLPHACGPCIYMLGGCGGSSAWRGSVVAGPPLRYDSSVCQHDVVKTCSVVSRGLVGVRAGVQHRGCETDARRTAGGAAVVCGGACGNLRRSTLRSSNWQCLCRNVDGSVGSFRPSGSCSGAGAGTCGVDLRK